MWMRNPMITLNNPYDSWLTQNSKWLPSKPAEYTGNIPHVHQTGTYESFAILSLGFNQTWKVDATTKLGWTTYIVPFSKWPPVKWNYVFAYYSASRIDGDKISVSKHMLFWMKNPIMTLKNPYNCMCIIRVHFRCIALDTECIRCVYWSPCNRNIQSHNTVAVWIQQDH